MAYVICRGERVIINLLLVFPHSMEKRVTDIMHKAFWDAFESSINEDPPSFIHAVGLIGEVREVCIFFLPFITVHFCIFACNVKNGNHFEF